MPTPGLEHIKPRQWLSISTLAEYARCPRKAFLHAMCRFTNPGETKAAMDFGTAMHIATPLVLQGVPALKAHESFLQYWDTNNNIRDYNPRTALAMLNSLEANHSITKLYTPTPPPEGTLQFSPESGRSPLEVPFFIDLGLKLPLFGWIDLIVKNNTTSDLWVVDIKTSGRSGTTSFSDAFTIHPQTYGYCVAMRAHGLNVRGTLILGGKVSGSQPQWSCEPYYIRDDQMEDFTSWARLQGERLLADWHAGQWTKNISACTAYPQHYTYGGKCHFIEHCKVPDWTTLSHMLSSQPSPMDAEIQRLEKRLSEAAP